MSQDEDSVLEQVHPTARRSTIKRGKRRRLSNTKRKRKLSFERVSIAERFRLKMKSSIGGGKGHPEVCVVRGERTVVSGYWTVVHIAFPIKNDPHAFKVMALIKMRQVLQGANQHSQAYLLSNGAYCSNDGKKKLGNKALKALELREAFGVVVVVSTWKNCKRLKKNSENIQNAVVDLLVAAGHTPGSAMSLYAWGKGHALISGYSAGGSSDVSQVSKEVRRQKVLNALEKRLCLSETSKGATPLMFEGDNVSLRRSSRNMEVIAEKRKNMLTALERRMELQTPTESAASSSCEQSSPEDGGKLSEFMYELERSVVRAREIESEADEKDWEDFEKQVETLDFKAPGLAKVVR